MFHKRHNRTQTVAAPPAATGIPAARTVEAPPIVQESVRYDRVTEVQPVIHRTVDQVHVHHIEKHIMTEAAPSMGGSYERPPLIQDHVNHRYITEVHPVYHGASTQYEEAARTMSGPLQPYQQGGLQQGALQQGAFATQGQQQFPQQNPIQANSFAPTSGIQQNSYLPQQQTVASNGFAPGYTSAAPTAPAAKGRSHHIFHRPTNADGRY